MRNRLFIPLLALISAILLFACSAAKKGDNDYNGGYYAPGGLVGGDEFTPYTENAPRSVAEHPAQALSLTMNTAGFSVLERMAEEGRTPPKDAVRPEQMLNAFKYDYPAPADGEELTVTGYLSAAPWDGSKKLMTVGVRTRDIELSALASHFVFLLDVSGSMSGYDRFELVRQSLDGLVRTLSQKDRVSIVTYAGAERTVLAGVTGDRQQEILSALNSVQVGGGTNGSGGIKRAYELANDSRYFIEGGNNRIVLATDGDFNLGNTDKLSVEDFVRAEAAKKGVQLTVLGVGFGNLKNNRLEGLADAGNGNHAYISNIAEGIRVLVEDAGAFFTVAAKDVKANVEFGAGVESYRLMGYDMRTLTEAEWNDEGTDAGELGGGVTVTAVFEVTPSAQGGDVGTVSVRYKTVDGDEREVSGGFTATENADTAQIANLLELALVLRDSEYKADASIASVLARLQSVPTAQRDARWTRIYAFAQNAARLFVQQ
jgi:Ca-activated chloride channel family protein